MPVTGSQGNSAWWAPTGTLAPDLLVDVEALPDLHHRLVVGHHRRDGVEVGPVGDLVLPSLDAGADHVRDVAVVVLDVARDPAADAQVRPDARVLLEELEHPPRRVLDRHEPLVGAVGAARHVDDPVEGDVQPGLLFRCAGHSVSSSRALRLPQWTAAWRSLSIAAPAGASRRRHEGASPAILAPWPRRCLPPSKPRACRSSPCSPASRRPSRRRAPWCSRPTPEPARRRSCRPPCSARPFSPAPGMLVLEPRRIAAVAAAARIGELLGERLGETAGYSVRLERRVSSRTRIEIVTEGLAVRRIIDDPGLQGIGLVILDEFHERSVHADLALALLLEARVLRPDLRILVMSATLDAPRIAAFVGCPSLLAPGRAHPVETRWEPAAGPGRPGRRVRRRLDRPQRLARPRRDRRRRPGVPGRRAGDAPRAGGARARPRRRRRPDRRSPRHDVARRAAGGHRAAAGQARPHRARHQRGRDEPDRAGCAGRRRFRLRQALALSPPQRHEPPRHRAGQRRVGRPEARARRQARPRPVRPLLGPRRASAARDAARDAARRALGHGARGSPLGRPRGRRPAPSRPAAARPVAGRPRAAAGPRRHRRRRRAHRPRQGDRPRRPRAAARRRRRRRRAGRQPPPRLRLRRPARDARRRAPARRRGLQAPPRRAAPRPLERLAGPGVFAARAGVRPPALHRRRPGARRRPPSRPGGPAARATAAAPSCSPPFPTAWRSAWSAASSASSRAARPGCAAPSRRSPLSWPSRPTRAKRPARSPWQPRSPAPRSKRSSLTSWWRRTRSHGKAGRPAPAV